MSGITSISQVKDAYDLIELYAELDKNADGVLGPNEVSAEEIAAGDLGGVDSANFNVKDGSLSPWEVAQMRGFKWEDVRPLRIANQIHGRTFQDIERLPSDMSIGGYTFKAGTPLRFHYNGRVREGTTALNHSGRDYLPAGTRLYFDAKKQTPERVILGRECFAGGDGQLHFNREEGDSSFHAIPLPAGTTKIYSGWGALVNKREGIAIDGVRYSRIEFETRQQIRTLAQNVSVPLSDLPNKRISFQAGERLKFVFDLKGFQSVTLRREARLFNMILPPGTYIGRPEEGVLIVSSPRRDLRLGEAKYRSLRILSSTQVLLATLDKETTLRVGNRRLVFAADETMVYDTHGRLKSGVLAREAPSHRGSGRLWRAGSRVLILKNGNMAELSGEGFHRLFPNIQLSGTWSASEIELITLHLEKLPVEVRKSIRGIHLSVKDEGKADYVLDEWGHANRLNMTIYLWRDVENYLDLSAFQHEAAHVFTFQQERIAAQIIQRRTSHINTTSFGSAFLDTSSSRAIAEEGALIRQEIARSLQGRWEKLVIDAGVEYGKLARRKGDATISMEWIAPDAKGEREGPRFGFVRSYGSKNFYEDVATHVEMIWRNPDGYRQLIDPGSHFYEMHEDQKKFAPVYSAKLNMLREFGFITEEKYREILPQKPRPMHSRIASFCANEGVNCP